MIKKITNNIFKKFFRKHILIIIALLSSFLFINDILLKALNYNSLNSDSSVSNHFLNNFEMSETDIYGQITWILSGDKLEKFPNSLRSEVTMPIMNIRSSEKSFWIVRADHALDPDSLFKAIYLKDNVIFNKYDDNKINEVKIITTKAIIYPDEEIIETSEFATITTPNSKTSGDGVIADMKQGKVTILSNAKRLSTSDERSEELKGETMLYDLNKKTWVLLKKDGRDDKIKIQNRVKTILKTKKAK
jgi:LPS export ABC transporter protein LptC